MASRRVAFELFGSAITRQVERRIANVCVADPHTRRALAFHRVQPPASPGEAALRCRWRCMTFPIRRSTIRVMAPTKSFACQSSAKHKSVLARLALSPARSNARRPSARSQEDVDTTAIRLDDRRPDSPRVARARSRADDRALQRPRDRVLHPAPLPLHPRRRTRAPRPRAPGRPPAPRDHDRRRAPARRGAGDVGGRARLRDRRTTPGPGPRRPCAHAPARLRARRAGPRGAPPEDRA